MKFIDALIPNTTETENGMPTLTGAGSACVDLFFQIGAARNLSEGAISTVFTKAFQEDALTAFRIMFYNRDVREGQGERRSFYEILRLVANTVPDHFRPNVVLIPQLGRYDDLLQLMDTPLELEALKVIRDGLKDGNVLCAKWMPRKGPNAARIREHLNLSPKTYRKLLVKLCKEGEVVEQKMCAGKWNKIDYNHLPSKAANIYRKAFKRNDEDRYVKYLSGLEKGTTKVNAGAIFPHEIVHAYSSGSAAQDKLLDAQWKALPNYMEGNTKGLIPICDVSGSMSGLPLEVSVALGMYISERNVGPFKDAFITFSNNPQLHVIKGTTLGGRIASVSRLDWEMTTNLEKTFALILDQSVKNDVKAKDMPGTVLILSDMQFNECSAEPSNTAMEMIEKKYKAAGYKVPNVVFWNLRAVLGQSPVEFTKRGTALVSGFSPSILKNILAAKGLTPVDIMNETIGKPRYAGVTVGESVMANEVTLPKRVKKVVKAAKRK